MKDSPITYRGAGGVTSHALKLGQEALRGLKLNLCFSYVKIIWGLSFAWRALPHANYRIICRKRDRARKGR